MARERYLWNDDGEEPIRKAVSELPPPTKKDKRKNFWHYYRFHFIAGALVVIFFGAMIWDISSNKDPDYSSDRRCYPIVIASEKWLVPD